MAARPARRREGAPVPRSDPAAVDPEEASVAALASGHMPWFLSLAAERGWVVVVED